MNGVKDILKSKNSVVSQRNEDTNYNKNLDQNGTNESRNNQSKNTQTKDEAHNFNKTLGSLTD